MVAPPAGRGDAVNREIRGRRAPRFGRAPPLRLSGSRIAVVLPRMTGTSTAQMGRLGGALSLRLQLLLGILAALLVLVLVLR